MRCGGSPQMCGRGHRAPARDQSLPGGMTECGGCQALTAYRPAALLNNRHGHYRAERHYRAIPQIGDAAVSRPWIASHPAPPEAERSPAMPQPYGADLRARSLREASLRQIQRPRLVSGRPRASTSRSTQNRNKVGNPTRHSFVPHPKLGEAHGRWAERPWANPGRRR